MKRLMKILCAVIISVTALVGLSCVASADSFDDNIIVDITTTPKGTILDGIYVVKIVDSKKVLTPVIDTATKQDVEDIIRASLMQDLVPAMEEAVAKATKSYANSGDYTKAYSTFSSSKDGTSSEIFTYLSAPRWGNVLSYFLDNGLDKGNAWGTDFTDRDFFEVLADAYGITYTYDDTQLFLNFSDQDTVYSLLLTPDNIGLVREGIRKAVLKSLIKYTYCIYEYDGSTQLAPISSMSSSMHLAYIVQPFVGVIPCRGEDFIIEDFDDYYDYFYAEDKIKMRASANIDNDIYINKYNSENDTSYDLYTILDSIYAGSSLLDWWCSTPYTCFFLGAPIHTQENKQGIYLHPDYVAFFMQTMSADPEYVVGLNSINKESGLDNTFVARQNALQSPKCYLLSLHPLGYIEEWKYTSIFGIFQDIFTVDPSTKTTLAYMAYRNGISVLGKPDDTVSYRYNYVRDLKASIPGVTTEDEAGRAIGSYYYYDVITGKVYRTIPAEAKPVHNSEVDTSSNKPCILVSPQAGTLLGRYESTDIQISPSNLYQATLEYIPPTVDAYRGISGEDGGKKIYYDIKSNQLGTVVIPSVYRECISIQHKDSTQDAVSGAIEEKKQTQLVGTGRNVAIDFSHRDTINLLETDGTVKYTESGEPAAGVYYNTGGRLLTSDKTNIKMAVYMLSDGPSLLLNDDYIEQSNLLAWLETSQAGTYISGNANVTGYTADKLYQHLISRGVSLEGKVDIDDEQRLEDIKNELEQSKQTDIVTTILTIASFIGIFVMVYACLLVICFYIDIFNTIMNFSLLNLITVGGYKAIAKKSDLEDLGITDPKEQKKYVDRFGIIGLWALTMGIGLLLFGSNQVFIWVNMLYNWLTNLFGV